MKKLKILVLFGGKSAEHEVSPVSAKFILENIDRKRFIPELVFIDPKGQWHSADAKLLGSRVAKQSKALANNSKALAVSTHLLQPPSRPHVVFPALHGPMGEDGTVQGMLELSGIAYVGCGVLGSAVGMDKEVTKRLAMEAGLSVLPYRCIHHPAKANAAAAALGYPLFVKPARLGSSVGVSKVKGPRDLARAVKSAFEYDDKVLLEKGILAREIECGVLGDPWSQDAADPLRLQASICGEIVPNAEFYTYESKYLDPEGAKRLIPAPISAAASQRIQQMAMAAFRALDGYAMARVDFLMDKETDAVYFNEINTIPGFTPVSMYPALWQASGFPPQKLVSRLVELALRRQKTRSEFKNEPS